MPANIFAEVTKLTCQFSKLNVWSSLWDGILANRIQISTDWGEGFEGWVLLQKCRDPGWLLFTQRSARAGSCCYDTLPRLTALLWIPWSEADSFMLLGKGNCKMVVSQGKKMVWEPNSWCSIWDAHGPNSAFFSKGCSLPYWDGAWNMLGSLF